MATNDREKTTQNKKKAARPTSRTHDNPITSGRNPDEGTKAVENSPETSTFAGTSTLYVVATPIGHMGDITERAQQILASVDVVLCEDTRVTGMLMKRLGLSSPLMAYHEHNAHRIRPQILERLQQGQRVALVSDAGTPLISDPGYKLVQSVTQHGIKVTPIPGACALVTALMSAGQPTDRFLFAGFLPARQKARCDVLRTLASIQATLVFYESVHRLPKSLEDMKTILGPRAATVCRELTKLHEDIRRDSLDNLASYYALSSSLKGEVVVVIAPPPDDPEKQEPFEVDHLLECALNYLSVRDATALVAEQSGIKKSHLYARALELTGS